MPQACPARLSGKVMRISSNATTPIHAKPKTWNAHLGALNINQMATMTSGIADAKRIAVPPIPFFFSSAGASVMRQSG